MNQAFVSGKNFNECPVVFDVFDDARIDFTEF